jgi:phosphonate transport system substrate-binding protein
VQAEKIADAKVLLKSVRRGQAVFYSAIITAKGYKSLDELKGKTIAWTDPSSSSGHIVPKSSLMDLNIDPDTYFSKQVFAGGHDALVLAVANGTVDAGATFCNGAHGEDGAWNQFLKDPEQLKKINILHVSKPIPGDTLSTTAKFQAAHPDVVEKFVKIMAELGSNPEGKKILHDLYRIESMVPAKSEDYEPLRVAMRRLKISER